MMTPHEVIEADQREIAKRLCLSNQRISQLMRSALDDFRRTWELLEYVTSVDIETASEFELARE